MTGISKTGVQDAVAPLHREGSANPAVRLTAARSTRTRSLAGDQVGTQTDAEEQGRKLPSLIPRGLLSREDSVLSRVLPTIFAGVIGYGGKLAELALKAIPVRSGRSVIRVRRDFDTTEPSGRLGISGDNAVLSSGVILADRGSSASIRTEHRSLFQKVGQLNYRVISLSTWVLIGSFQLLYPFISGPIPIEVVKLNPGSVTVRVSERGRSLTRALIRSRTWSR